MCRRWIVRLNCGHIDHEFDYCRYAKPIQQRQISAPGTTVPYVGPSHQPCKKIKDKGSRDGLASQTPLSPRHAGRLRLRKQAAQLGLLQVCWTSQYPRYVRGYARAVQSCVLPSMRALYGTWILAKGSPWSQNERDAEQRPQR
jgi:hypothetical protein